MHSGTIITLVYTCWVVLGFVQAVRGRPLHPFSVVACVMSPMAYMALNAAPGMHTVLGQWLVAIVNILGPAVVGTIVAIRHIRRSTRIPA